MRYVLLNLILRLSFFRKDKSSATTETEDNASCNVWIRDYLDAGDTGLTWAEVETELAALQQLWLKMSFQCFQC